MKKLTFFLFLLTFSCAEEPESNEREENCEYYCVPLTESKIYDSPDLQSSVVGLLKDRTESLEIIGISGDFLDVKTGFIHNESVQITRYCLKYSVHSSGFADYDKSAKRRERKAKKKEKAQPKNTEITFEEFKKIFKTQ